MGRWAVVTATATLLLVCAGGLVTSKGAGMAVPDWPNTYGHNLFLFPVSQWVGGIFYEHTHRLLGAAVGMLTLVLAVMLWFREPRRWVRWLGLAALVGVIVQGVLGGLRVVLLQDEIGIVHAALAQVFFCLVCALVLFTSAGWDSLRRRPLAAGAGRSVRLALWISAGMIFGQLLLGAAMRHQHAGLAIPDFPLAYGRVWPATDADSIARYNQQRMEVTAANPITASHLHLHMAHRYWAVAVTAAVLGTARFVRRRLGPTDPLTRLSWAWLGLVGVQVALGAATVWTGKNSLIATAHVAVGSLCLAGAVLAGILAQARFSASSAALAHLPANRQCAEVMAYS
jgi:cytochrome c oxidase assembly protein subunit 15